MPFVDVPSADQPEYIRQIVNQLPKYNRYILQHLMQFCKQIYENVAATKMNPQNLAIVLGPILVADKVQSLDMSKHTLVFNLLSSMVLFYDIIFQDVIAERERNRQAAAAAAAAKTTTTTAATSTAAV